MRIEILEDGVVVRTIEASEEFAQIHYPGKWQVAAVQENQQQDDPTAFLIDIGPFFDRFGSAKMQVLVSTDLGVKAILSDLQVRKWIDLRREDVAQGLQYVGSVIPAVTQELQLSILNNAVTPEENLVLRKLYFN